MLKKILLLLLLFTMYSQCSSRAETTDANWVFGTPAIEYKTPSADWYPQPQLYSQQQPQPYPQQQAYPQQPNNAMYSIQPINNQIQQVSSPYNDYYQGIKLPAGTAITIRNKQEINADHVREGQIVDFIVDSPVTLNGLTVIKPNASVTAEVINKRNNFIFGIPGDLQVGNFKLTNLNNKSINLTGTISKKGTSRYWAHIGWLIVWPLLLVKGEDGKIPAGTRHTIYTMGDVYLPMNNPPINYQQPRYY